jgi:hypothetical protein
MITYPHLSQSQRVTRVGMSVVIRYGHVYDQGGEKGVIEYLRGG